MRFNSPAAGQKAINDAARARAAGLTWTSPRGDVCHVPGFAMTSAELITHCPALAKTRSTAAYALEPPVRPTAQTLSCAAKACVPESSGMAVATTNNWRWQE
jgi:hypothetical protein